MMSFTIVAIILSCIVIFILLYGMETRRNLQHGMRSFRLSPEPNEKMADSSVENWIGKIHGMWYVYGGAIAGLTRIYQAWKDAPGGSSAKLGWGALLAVIIAVGLLMLLRFIDGKINGHESPPHAPADDLSAQMALMQMGEKNDPSNR